MSQLNEDQTVNATEVNAQPEQQPVTVEAHEAPKATVPEVKLSPMEATVLNHAMSGLNFNYDKLEEFTNLKKHLEEVMQGKVSRNLNLEEATLCLNVIQATATPLVTISEKLAPLVQTTNPQ